MKFKAAILTELKKELTIAEITLPEKLEVGQVLVKVAYSGICGSQLGEIDGKKGEDKFLPHLLGHEASGEVIEVGAGVRTTQKGDKVVLHWKRGIGIDSECPKYDWNGKVVNAGWIATFNEYAVISENRITKLPDNFDMRIAPLFGCAVTTGLGVINNNAMVKIGESVVVYGAGGVGLNIIQGASLSGAYPIIAVDLHDNRLELAKELGATHTINATSTDAETAIKKILENNGADIVIDNTGIPKIIELCYELTQPKGKTILVGVPKKGDDISIHSLPLHFGKQLTGSFGGETDPTIDIPRYAKLYQAGLLKLDELITAEYALEDINDAIADMRSGKLAGRCVIKMNHN